MKQSYVEQKFPRYFIFGENSDGSVDIATVENSTICTVSPDEALVLITHRDDILKMLTALAIEFDKIDPDKFEKLWYGKDDVK